MNYINIYIYIVDTLTLSHTLTHVRCFVSRLFSHIPFRSAHGADTVLLIVAILDDNLLTLLINKCRELQMEPLVEVNSVDELTRALSANALVIGVNNRNLHTFQVDMGTTERVASALRERNKEEEQHTSEEKEERSEEVTRQEYEHEHEHEQRRRRHRLPLIVALSGIKARSDVVRYEKAGIRGILVGEALMRASNPHAMVQALLGGHDDEESKRPVSPLVKICGVRTVEDALVAARAGANFIGMIFVKNSKRYVGVEVACEIVKSMKKFREDREEGSRMDWSQGAAEAAGDSSAQGEGAFYQHWRTILRERCMSRPPLTVGVFVNTGRKEMLDIVRETGIDLIQLHGDEGFHGFDLTSMEGTPCIRVVHVNSGKESSSSSSSSSTTTTTTTTTSMQELLDCDVPVKGPCCALLLDTKVSATGVSGGTGVAFDWKLARKVKDAGYPVIVAGGLNPRNVEEACRVSGAWCVDVSSGVENKETGFKDHEKIQQFVKRAKSVVV